MTSPGTAWSRAFLAGIAAMLAMSFIPWVPIIFALLAAVAGAFGPRGATVSGVLVGFGGLWLLLVAMQVLTGGQSDQLPLIIGTGIGAVVIGVGVGVVTVDR